MIAPYQNPNPNPVKRNTNYQKWIVIMLVIIALLIFYFTPVGHSLFNGIYAFMVGLLTGQRID